ncbi:unnamed protein product, partial [Rotaria sp. Silwood1]
MYLFRNILEIISEENFSFVMSKINEKNIKVTRDILLNNHTSAEDKRRFHRLMGLDQHLPLSTSFDIDHHRNEHLIDHFQFFISSQISLLVVSDEDLMKLISVLLFTVKYDVLRDE